MLTLPGGFKSSSYKFPKDAGLDFFLRKVQAQYQSNVTFQYRMTCICIGDAYSLARSIAERVKSRGSGLAHLEHRLMFPPIQVLTAWTPSSSSQAATVGPYQPHPVLPTGHAVSESLGISRL